MKIKKVHHYFFGRGKADAFTTTEYIDGFQYKNESGLIGVSNGLQFFGTSEGYYDYVNNRYIYHYSDHLGNVRVSFAKENNTAVIVQQNDYYAFGLKHDIPGHAFSDYKYSYNGKEMQDEIGMYDYGARFYMPDLGRWGVVDPLAEISRRFSPYMYGNNNPIKFVDPDGRNVRDVNGDGSHIIYDGDSAAGMLSFLQGMYSENGNSSSNYSTSFNFSYLDAGGATGGGGGSSLSSWMQINIGGFYDIHVGKNGKVNKVNGDENNYHRFFDDQGKQMYFNDPNGVNKSWISRTFKVGDRLYYPVSIDEMFSAINSVPLNGYIKGSRLSLGSYAAIWKESTMGEADFSGHFLSKVIGEKNGQYVYQNDSSYNIRFGNSNMIFSLMDAGNAMWGLWMRSMGVTNLEIRKASNWYEKIYNGVPDTAADQRAMFYFLNILDKKK